MKSTKCVAILFILILVLAGCTTTKEYHQTFNGSSDHWSAEIIEEGKVIYRNHPDHHNQSEIEYEANHTLNLLYIGNEADLGQFVEYEYDSGKGSLHSSDGELLTVDDHRTLSHSGGSSGISHLPKSIEYSPVSNRDKVYIVTIKWKNKEESIRLNASSSSN